MIILVKRNEEENMIPLLTSDRRIMGLTDLLSMGEEAHNYVDSAIDINNKLYNQFIEILKSNRYLSISKLEKLMTFNEEGKIVPEKDEEYTFSKEDMEWLGLDESFIREEEERKKQKFEQEKSGIFIIVEETEDGFKPFINKSDFGKVQVFKFEETAEYYRYMQVNEKKARLKVMSISEKTLGILKEKDFDVTLDVNGEVISNKVFIVVEKDGKYYRPANVMEHSERFYSFKTREAVEEFVMIANSISVGTKYEYLKVSEETMTIINKESVILDENGEIVKEQTEDESIFICVLPQIDKEMLYYLPVIGFIPNHFQLDKAVLIADKNLNKLQKEYGVLLDELKTSARIIVVSMETYKRLVDNLEKCGKSLSLKIRQLSLLKNLYGGEVIDRAIEETFNELREKGICLDENLNIIEVSDKDKCSIHLEEMCASEDEGFMDIFDDSDDEEDDDDWYKLNDFFVEDEDEYDEDDEYDEESTLQEALHDEFDKFLKSLKSVLDDFSEKNKK